MDYRELLKKYIEHVVSCEGVNYINRGNSHSEIEFTQEEKLTLDILSWEEDENN